MINPRLLLQLPLILLGSCVPLQTPTSINIYTSVGRDAPNAVVRDIVSLPITAKEITAHTGEGASQGAVAAADKAASECNKALEATFDIDVAAIDKPDLSGTKGKSKDELNKAVADALLTNIKLLRSENKRLVGERKCMIQEINRLKHPKP